MLTYLTQSRALAIVALPGLLAAQGTVAGQADRAPRTTPADCNANLVDDALDIASGRSDDCNGNLVPDECEVLAQVHLRESFEGGLPSGWSASGLWHVTDQCSRPSSCAGTQYAYFGDDLLCSFDRPSASGTLALPPIDLPPDASAAFLSFCSAYEGEGEEPYDAADVFVNGALLDHVSTRNQLEWETRRIDLFDFAGATVHIEFVFQAMDDTQNDFLGWQIDDVRVVSLAPGAVAVDCNLNGLPDDCEVDCNANGVPDECDIASGTSDDCQLNGVPDECDVAGGASFDCNANGLPDECDISSPLELGLARLATRHSAIQAHIPDRFDFVGGESGTRILDGGLNMYDSGNQLRTPHTSALPYTGSTLVSSTAFGPGSRYFTAKFDGLFLLAAAGCSIDWFFVTGSNGTDDPSGPTDAFEATFVADGLVYSLFLRRVYGTAEPSVNQLLIVPGDGSGLTHTPNSDPRVCAQFLEGLGGVERFYYLLASRHAGGLGQPLELVDALAAAREFVTIVPAPVSRDDDGNGIPDECR